MSSARMLKFVTKLKNKNVDVRKRAALDLNTYVKTELREVSPEERAAFNDEFNKHIFGMVNSSDNNEKIGGILAILCLISDIDNKNNRISRFANYLRNLLPCSDLSVMELAAKTVGKLALHSGTYADQYIEFEVKRAFELLTESGVRNEHSRYAAVLLLKEIATMVPTLYFQHATRFFDLVITVTKDPKVYVREKAVDALRAAFIVTAQREKYKQTPKSQWYTHCYNQVMECILESTKEKAIICDDKLHGSLLALNELFRISNNSWEKQSDLLIQRLQLDQSLSSVEILSLLTRTKSVLKGLVSGSGRTDNDLVRIESSDIWFESSNCKKLLHSGYELVCTTILDIKLVDEPQILSNAALLKLIPRLVAFNTTNFIQNYLNSTMLNLLANARSQDRNHRNNSFVTIGLVAILVKDHIKAYMPIVLDVIWSILPTKENLKKKTAIIDPALYFCITLLGIAMPHIMKASIKEIIEPMLAMGLSSILTVSLKELVVAIPTLKKDISEGLLRMLSQVLNYNNTSMSDINYICLPVEPENVSKVVLALNTLGNFNFEGHSLLRFLSRCAVCYLSSEQKDIKIESIRTCSRLLHLVLQSPYGKSSHVVRYTVSIIIRQILDIGVVDIDPDIRYAALENLRPSFDFYLAQVQNIPRFFSALNDLNIEIREMAMCILGRLGTVNPAYVIASMRSVLLQYLYEIQYSGMAQNNEQCSRMIDHMVIHCPYLVFYYMQPILKTLVPKLHEPDLNPSILIYILTCIGDLAQVNGKDMWPWIDELVPLLLDMLGDCGSHEKRGVSLWVLGKLVEGLGYVVLPYTKYPTLLDTLLGFLKTEQQPLVRRETIRVLGLLGALDPYKYKMILGQIDSQLEYTALLSITDSRPISETEWTSSEILVNMRTASLDDYYPAVTIATLIRIIRDPNLSQHHIMVVQAITFIFQSLGLKCVTYIAQVLPSYLNVIRTTDPNFREYLLTQLVVLINIVGQHIQNHVDDVFILIKELWTPNSSLQCAIIQLVESIVVALGPQFRTHLCELIPNIIRVLHKDSSNGRVVTKRMMIALCKFGINLDDCLHIILPAVVNLFDATHNPIQVSQLALETVMQFCYILDINCYSSLIIHGIIIPIQYTPELRKTAMETLCVLICHLGHNYAPFIHLVSSTLKQCQYHYPLYDTLMTYISSTKIGSLEEKLLYFRHKQFKTKKETGTHAINHPGTIIKKMYTSLSNLQKAWQINRCVSNDDWLEWLRRLSIDLLKESPSPALRSCWALAQTYSQLPKDLFNAAFVSCWTQLPETIRNELIQSLEQALMVSDLPEMTQTILNLAEFMDHTDIGPLPINPHILGERAMDCKAYAKALHYKENEYIEEKHRRVCPNIVESLISINNKLQQKEAASSILEMVMSKQEKYLEPGDQLKIQARWYEKLQNWEQALSSYEGCLQKEPHNIEWSLGEMRCLESLGKWEKLNNIVSSHWLNFPENGRVKMSRVAASAAWGLKKWSQMADYVERIPRDTIDGAFYRSVVFIHKEQYEYAQKFIDLAREMLDTELTAMAAESYQRAYGTMVSVQILAELEEVIQYKLKPKKRQIIYKTWQNRLQGCQKVVEDWQRIIQVHSLVLSPQEDMHSWLKYAALCRKSSRLGLSNKTLIILLGKDPSNTPTESLPMIHPHVTFAYIKYMWTSGAKSDACKHLNYLIKNVLPQLRRKEKDSEKLEFCSTKKLLARCYLKLGRWQEELHGVAEFSIASVLECYGSATSYDPNWYKAWHSWAYMNFKAVLFYKHEQNILQLNEQKETPDISSSEAVKLNQYISQFTVPAVEGFFRSISLSNGSSLQETLRLLTLLFDYGENIDVYDSIGDGFKTIGIKTWLQVIPQLIARIDTPFKLVSRLIHQLLIDIGKQHPQALVYPLTLANKSASIRRKIAANKILRTMCEHSSTLVHQAVMVSDELLRAAIVWHEMWHEALEEASRLYFTDHNPKGMCAILKPLHAIIERGPQTLEETSFSLTYSHDLAEAKRLCNNFLVTGDIVVINQAWDIYYHVFRRISKQLTVLTTLELQYVSPKLHQLRDTELAVPGSYVPGSPIVKIRFIKNSLQVITSKQRPRKLYIKGSDGNDYIFLLKGHEDLRQDERVMQLFGLINSLMHYDSETFNRNLSIQRYPVIPLSTNSGLIGWVPHCDTLHSLIRDYRNKKKILLNIEHRIMLRMSQNFENLILMQKVEVFEHAEANTQGDDLAKLMWHKSPSSEVWFDRRTNYTMSLAVMSMVGYILGLGDRHPSNIMLDRLSGKILHIDFGDCFEVAMTREKFPEKIPFRLTRLLVNAMEISGINGTYRSTCESVMTVLRDNKDSLMAVLEAFVYDPLLNWRLIEPEVDVRKSVATTTLVDETKPKSIVSVATMILDEASISDSFPASLSKKTAPMILSLTGDPKCNENEPTEALNKKALAIVTRVHEKLTGRDFIHEQELPISRQVDLLIQQATSKENLCQCYIGWCPFW